LKGKLCRSLAISAFAPMHYGQILGEPAPIGKQLQQLPFEREQLYRMLGNDHIAPVRVILGYFGYNIEHTFGKTTCGLTTSMKIICQDSQETAWFVP
jgi:hypothetical protein